MSNLILITGNDTIAVKNNATKAATEIKNKLESEYTFEIINGEDENISPQKILESFLISINTPSFFGEKKTVWLKHFSYFKNLTGTTSTNKEFQKFFKTITETIESLITDDSLQLIIDGPDLDKRTALYKFCIKNGEVFEFEKLKSTDKTYQINIRNKIKELCEEEKVKIEGNAIEFLSEAIGSDTGRLTSEISKLSSYISGTSDTITLKHCQEICTKTIEMANWIFSEALAEKDLKQSFYSLNILIDNLLSDSKSGSNPELTMFFSAVRKFQEIMKTKFSAAELNISGNMPYNSFQNLLSGSSGDSPKNHLINMHPYRAYMLYKQSANFKNIELPGIFAELLKTNKELVSGNNNTRILLENLIFKICSQKGIKS